MSKTRLPGLPATANVGDGKTRQVLDRINEILGVLKGERGNSLDRAVTFRDLVDADLAEESISIPDNPEDGPPVDRPGPPKRDKGRLCNVTTSGALYTVGISWSCTNQPGYSHAEIIAWQTDNLAEAVDNLDQALIGTDNGRFFTHNLGSNGSRYYWVRPVYDDGSKGLWNDSAGTLGETAKDPTAVLENISGEIADSDLTSTLQTRLDTIESNEQAIITQDSEIDGLEAQYTVKIDSNGSVAGFGLASVPRDDTSDGQFTEFIVNADRFAILPSTEDVTNGGTVPFTVTVNDEVVIDTAIIEDASIKRAKIGSVAFSSVEDSGGASVVVNDKLQAAYIEADQLSVAEAAEFTGIVESSNYDATNKTGWRLDPNGDGEFYGELSVGTLDIQDGAISEKNARGRVSRTTETPSNWTTMATIFLDTNDLDVIGTFGLLLDDDGNSDLPIVGVRIRETLFGSTLWRNSGEPVAARSEGLAVSVAGTFFDSVTQGSSSYNLDIIESSGKSVGIKNYFISGIVLKR